MVNLIKTGYKFRYDEFDQKRLFLNCPIVLDNSRESKYVRIIRRTLEICDLGIVFISEEEQPEPYIKSYKYKINEFPADSFISRMRDTTTRGDVSYMNTLEFLSSAITTKFAINIEQDLVCRFRVSVEEYQTNTIDIGKRLLEQAETYFIKILTDIIYIRAILPAIAIYLSTNNERYFNNRLHVYQNVDEFGNPRLVTCGHDFGNGSDSVMCNVYHSERNIQPFGGRNLDAN